MTALEPPFPCPFCQSSHVALVGGGLVFLHYKCSDCAEVWTAMAAPRPAVLRPATFGGGHSIPMSGPFETPASPQPPRDDREPGPTPADEERWMADVSNDVEWPRPADGGRRRSDRGARSTKFWRH